LGTEPHPNLVAGNGPFDEWNLDLPAQLVLMFADDRLAPVEPMTCAPDAFDAASYEFDTGLLVLVPGGSAIAAWRIAAISVADINVFTNTVNI
jgi:hypothetical protein